MFVNTTIMTLNMNKRVAHLLKGVSMQEVVA